MKLIRHLVIFTLLLLNSCDYITDLKRTGEVITIDLPWNGSVDIDVKASCRLVLINSEETRIQITGMDFIAEDYDLTNHDEKLIIRHSNPNRLQQDKVPDILLYAPVFKSLTINAPCQIISHDTLFFSDLRIIVNGKGIYTDTDLTLKGASFNLAVYGGINKNRHKLRGYVSNVNYHIEGGTDIEAIDLKTIKTNITHRSFGHCYVSATEQLNITIFSTGNVYYTGNPELNVENRKNSLMEASGKVYKLGE